MTLPPYLVNALKAIKEGQGDDIYYVLGYLSDSAARSYVSKLKKMGFAYTYVNSGTTEVWLHKKGVDFLKNLENLEKGEDSLCQN